MRGVLVAVVLAMAAPSLAQTAATTTTLRVKVEATELDKKLLLGKLNEHGPGHRLKFELAEDNFDYRIEFSTAQGKTQTLIWGSGGSMNMSEATTAVYDSKGIALFSFKRSGRATDKGAANAVAKEIIKRLLQVRSLRKPNP